MPCHYKWFRIRNGLIEESYKFKGNSYVCDCADIGAVIQADVTVLIFVIFRVMIQNILVMLLFSLGQLD